MSCRTIAVDAERREEVGVVDIRIDFFVERHWERFHREGRVDERTRRKKGGVVEVDTAHRVYHSRRGEKEGQDKQKEKR